MNFVAAYFCGLDKEILPAHCHNMINNVGLALFSDIYSGLGLYRGPTSRWQFGGEYWGRYAEMDSG